MNPRLQYLFNAYITKTATAAERKELWTAVQDAGYANELQQLLGAEMENENSKYPISIEQANEIFARVIQDNDRVITPVHRIQKSPGATRHSLLQRGRIKTTWFKYAAAILIIAGIGAYLWNINKTEEPQTVKAETKKNEILPGGNKALLTLADGSAINLDSAANGQLTTQGNSKVIKTSTGQIIYESGSPSSQAYGAGSPSSPFEKGGRRGHPNGETAGGFKNTMSTPRGGQYQLTLSDGTRVWLNAASSITYPTIFNKTRTVSITGEVYFEVAPNKNAPFKVKTNNSTEVLVLGTGFNINAYKNENNTTTTLVEGSIKLIRNDKSAILTPGQQATIPYSQKEIIVKANADIKKAVAWKNGLFDFNGAGLQEMMRQLERWYDIDVKYEGKIPAIKLGGSLSHDLNLSQMLEILDEFKIKYTLKERTLIIKAM